MASLRVSEYLHLTWYGINSTKNKQTKQQMQQGKWKQWRLNMNNPFPLHLITRNTLESN